MYGRSKTSLAAGPHAGGQLALLALTGAGLLAICLVFAFVMAAWHRDVGRSLGASGEAMAAAVAQEVDRNIEILDSSVRAIAQQWRSDEVRGLPARLRDMVLFDNAMRARGFGSILVLDRDGHVAASSDEARQTGAPLNDRDYFRVHAASGSLGLFVSKPFRSRLSGRWIVALSRRIDDQTGAFDGVVVGTIDLDYLANLYAGLGVGPDSAVTLFRTDGTVITREPRVRADAHLWVGDGDAFTRMRSSRRGTFEGPSPVDGRWRILSFHRVGGLPLIQAVEVGGGDAYTSWWRRAAVVAALLALLCLCVMGLCVVLYRELGRRAEAEAMLSHLAGTDALTGLANRRRFDAALSAEWLGARTRGDHVALLIADADAFKAYNDLFGHQAGDEVLRHVAGRLDALARDHDGVACRWGGEEFALLLRGVDEAHALTVADGLCHAVRALGLEHPRGVEGIVTISVGVAVVAPASGGQAKDLFAAADAALYRAKAQGRDRSCGRPSPRPAVPPARLEEFRRGSGS